MHCLDEDAIFPRFKQFTHSCPHAFVRWMEVWMWPLPGLEPPVSLAKREIEASPAKGEIGGFQAPKGKEAPQGQKERRVLG